MSNHQRPISILLGVLAFTTAVASSAVAGPESGTPAASATPTGSPAGSPWAIGVSEDDQEKALALFESGNEHLSKLRFSDAASDYLEAFEHWDHPAIHYNLTIALIRLDRRVEAYEAIEKALQYGSAPLEPEQYQEALNYQALLRNQVAHIEIAVAQPGVSVQLDGQPIMSGPGSVKKAILPGHYQIFATRKGHEKVAHRELLLPGESRKVQLQLFTLEELTEVRRHWPAWKPWSLAGSGVAVAAVGGLWHWRAKAKFDEFDNDDFPKVCPGGCTGHDGKLRRGRWLQRIGVSHYAIGGTALATGLIVAFINRPRKERVNRDDESVRIFVQPTLSPEGPGASVGGSW